jgi:hypothetical protein
MKRFLESVSAAVGLSLLAIGTLAGLPSTAEAYGCSECTSCNQHSTSCPSRTCKAPAGAFSNCSGSCTCRLTSTTNPLAQCGCFKP